MAATGRAAVLSPRRCAFRRPISPPSRNDTATFPKANVEEILTGVKAPLPASHGSTDMPVWGPIFKALDPHDTTNKVRIANLVDYVASMQQK